MALPSSGTISASMINIESATVSTNNAPLSGNSSTPQTGSLVKRYDTATPTPVNQIAPHAYSEFYGKSFTAPDIPCAEADNIDQGSGNGYFEATIVSGSTVGAIIIYFYPQGVPDGVAYEFDGTTYNDLTSNTYGYAGGTGNNLNIVGDDDITGCTGANLIANSPITLNTSIWNGTSFGLNGGTAAIVTTNVNLNGTSAGITYTLVVPKPSASPSSGTLKIVGPCTGTGWDVKSFCPVTLPSFTSNSTESTFQGSCCATQNKTFFFARNATGGSSFNVDTNSLPQVGNIVFSENTGVTVLPNGYYRITSNTAIYVQNGVVSSISTGCSACVTQFDTTTTSRLPCNFTSSDNILYHDGSGTFPVVGDIVYSNSAGTTEVSGGNRRNFFADGSGSGSYTVQTAAPGGSNTGLVTSIDPCV